MKEIKVNADIRMALPEGISDEDAEKLIFNVLYDCLVDNVDHTMDFEIYENEVREII